MSPRGAIDGVTLGASGRVRLTGWCAPGDSIVETCFRWSTGQRVGPVDVFARPDVPNGIGFRIELEDAALLPGIHGGIVVLEYRPAGDVGAAAALSVWSGARPALASLAIERLSAELDSNVIDELVGRLARRSRAMEPCASGSPAGEAFSNIALQVGSLSFDRSVIVGHEGVLFLHAGSNRLHGQYSRPIDPKLVEQWAAMVAARADRCREVGAKFLQLVVPEKQSVLGRLHPDGMEQVTPLMRAVSDSIPPSLRVDAYRALVRVALDGRLPFRRLDSHLSFHGTEAIVREILASLSLVFDWEPPTLEPRSMSGDLVDKIALGAGREEVDFPVLQAWGFARNVPECVESHDPSGRHVGVMRAWRNDRAPCDASVMLFGNSVSERGSTPLGLSWWLARLFRSVTFVWHPEVLIDRVRAQRPDIVLAQTVERFLPLVPRQ